MGTILLRACMSNMTFDDAADGVCVCVCVCVHAGVSFYTAAPAPCCKNGRNILSVIFSFRQMERK